MLRNLYDRLLAWCQQDNDDLHTKIIRLKWFSSKGSYERWRHLQDFNPKGLDPKAFTDHLAECDRIAQGVDDTFTLPKPPKPAPQVMDEVEAHPLLRDAQKGRKEHTGEACSFLIKDDDASVGDPPGVHPVRGSRPE